MEMMKTPPHDMRAEQSVLGAMILDKEAILDIVEIIKADDFYRSAHSEIFDSIMTLYEKNAPVDMVTLGDELTRREALENVGGIEYLNDLTTAGIITTNAKYYAKIIEEKSMLRRLINASTEILEMGYSTETAENVLEVAEKSIFDISQKKNRDGFSSIKEILIETYEAIEKAYESTESITGLSTGFRDLDFKTSGLQRSDLILVAARPSMGKTAFSVNLCQNVATQNEGASVAIFSLEMAKAQLVQRMLATQAGVGLGKIRNGDLTPEDWAKLASASAPLSEAKVYIDDTPGITIMEMRAKCRRLKMEQGLDMIMIDYLQLMSGGGKQQSREQEISEISRGLKGIAREMDCPVIALSQLSRAPELRADHRPILSDLRESGAIEQDADIVMFLYRDEYYFNDSEKKGIGEVIIAKQRNGETGTVELAWLGDLVKFVNLERGDE
ncbi:replicative DNA helicase [Acidaminobacter sp. JC074]|uniref:replicative DNA helicase n=1 Tax=Acidaminobacter sp. JC074 TaxID=2530199 RepID=UPI001F0D95DA|nr:replicative DNA helicase [Acidaminobacter sp. JC074]MCH4891354.1 replicative DNA helicase [Acidaminobacter sp. JC074]